MHHGGADSSFTLEVATNWKLAVENYCESYHLPWVHPGLNSYSRLEDHYHIEAPGLYSGQGTLCLPPAARRGRRGLPRFREPVGPKWDEGAEYVALYPNVLLGVHRDHAFAIVLEPVSHDRTREHIHLYYPTPTPTKTLRARNAAQWKEVFMEDIGVVEGMQRGRFAAGFDGGRFSPAMDGPTHCFHAWVAGRMDAARDAGVTRG
jgi:choline monooxygenase